MKKQSSNPNSKEVIGTDGKIKAPEFVTKTSYK